ncbi:glutamate-rich protein 6 [Esox lucius]|uniref:FAM194 C-terminal domain-containing protein n=1 Tax=Esox lucius TaxID=8010 RepID=A0A3P8Z2L0_ESOLU|nr:glutamate-rich protein 6 [Esox lucius]
MDHLTDPPTPTSGFLGVLRYKRESQDPASDPRDLLPEPQSFSDSPVLCEYCGEKAKPPLDRAFAEEPELFCCAQYQQMCEMLAHERWLVLQRPDPEDDATLTPDNQQTRKEEELQVQARERAARRKQRERLYQEVQPTHPSEDSYTHFCRTISFLLSTCTPKEVQSAVTQHPAFEEDLEKQQGELLSDHASSKFGMSPHQEGAGVLEKYYACGMKFLTILPDSTGQVYYPSGYLALIIISDERRKVCIVYDDRTHDHPIRALFHSDGRATCYHSNGNVWLSLDVSGGQCLNEAGARIKRWRWSAHGQTPTPLRPVFLSLNSSMGVRVLGQEHVFVSFLAGGQQAKFSVGACVQPAAQGISNAPGSLTSKEELFLMAGRFEVHQIIRHLHQCLRSPSNPRRRRAAPTLSLLSLAKRLLNLSCSIQLEESERAFVQRCLQDCL